MDDTTRLRIWRRNEFKCVYCGYDGGDSYEAFRHLRIDHFKPEAIGGGDEDENLFTACAACSEDKSTYEFKSIEDARRWLRLYRKECSRPWFEAHVLANNDPADWDTPGRLRRIKERFNAGEDEPEQSN